MILKLFQILNPFKIFQNYAFFLRKQLCKIPTYVELLELQGPQVKDHYVSEAK